MKVSSSAFENRFNVTRRWLDLKQVLTGDWRSALMRSIPLDTATFLLIEQPDARLVQLAEECGGTIVTNDANLRQSAEAQGVPVMGVSELTLALRPKVRPGDELEVTIRKPGKNPNEGIAYLDDGTMVVVERAQRQVGANIKITVTEVLQ